MKDEAGPVVEVSVFSFLQCFDTTAWVTQKGTEPVKKTCATYPQCSLLEQVQEDTDGELVDPRFPGKRPIKQ